MRKVTLNLTDAASAALARVGSALTINQTDVVNKAVRLLDLVVATKEAGGRVMLVDRDGNAETLTIL